MHNVKIHFFFLNMIDIILKKHFYCEKKKLHVFISYVPISIYEKKSILKDSFHTDTLYTYSCQHCCIYFPYKVSSLPAIGHSALGAANISLNFLTRFHVYLQSFKL